MRDLTRQLSLAAISGGLAADVPSAELGPEDLAIAADVTARVRLAVAELPSGQRAAVVDFYLRGLTHRETAAALGIAAPAVKARLHKGRATLRARLRALWEGDMNDVVESNELVEMRVADVRRGAQDAKPAAHLVMLQEAAGERRLPIWIGPPEAMSLAFLLEGIDLPRPLATQFMHNTLRALGASVVEVRIDRLAERTYYAVAVVEGPSGRVEVDARPSDALNLAVLAGARVTARRELLEAVAGGLEESLGAFRNETFPESAKDMVAAHRAAVRAQSTEPSSQEP
jgi:bifunctional DNase/RNase